MRVAVTGTPGTGKTTATELLADRGVDATVVHLNDVVRDEVLWTERDDERDSLVADLDAIREWLTEREGVGWVDAGGVDDVGDAPDDPVVVVDSHLAHHLDADRVVVLRCAPDELEARLLDRGESEAKARENAESEALDVILSEAFETHGPESVYEVDTTGRDPGAVAGDVAAVIRGEREPSAGTVDFLDYLGEPGGGVGGDGEASAGTDGEGPAEPDGTGDR